MKLSFKKISLLVVLSEPLFAGGMSGGGFMRRLTPMVTEHTYELRSNDQDERHLSQLIIIGEYIDLDDKHMLIYQDPENGLIYVLEKAE
ncbi:hypothetical protein [Pseudobacteriovorax antillogorgiicola]|uniref:Uncharacterized protein n=1 Tax=Pseudobacteriovorax antillogorgiicola TaxID=1513793 RepID=A0A1Y6B9W8_9BACT|nr:hypothetical protein [Pseudobacteriovorax antillogorgiicola]TCS57481.1 hypothetical protein EDD56_103221 [Pseudobacteriovorax antillogorgiicola]SMF00547.1 hypothetical protein SAMN06296036_103112 [Pseudobacteriovorax antillogorgiicola]